MSIEIRDARREDLPAILALADEVFFSKRPTMGATRPHVYNPENIKNSVVALDDGRLVSHFGMRRYILHIEGVDVPVACASGVCTLPEYRGRGLAGSTMDLAVRMARDRGAVLMPVSGWGNMYKKRQVRQLGPCWSLSVQSDRLPEPAGRPCEASDSVGVLALHETLPVRYRWDEDGVFPLLLKAARAQGFTMWMLPGAHGRVLAWAAIDKAVGHSILLRDWAGSPDDVARLCARALAESNVATVRVRIFWHQAEALRFFISLASEKTKGLSYDPTLKILDLPRLVSLFHDRLEPLRARAGGETLTVRVGAKCLCVDDPVIILNLMFVRSDCWIDPTNSFPFPSSLGTELQPFLPLPFPDYGIGAA